MRRLRVRRLSGPAVTIGYILLIPSLVGMALTIIVWLLSVVGLSATGSALSETTLAKLRAVGVPEAIVEKVRDGHPSEEERRSLTPDQAAAVDEAIRERVDTMAGAGLAAGCSTVFLGIAFVASFVSGLLGWLLTMKKTVLRCVNCRAEVAAS